VLQLLPFFQCVATQLVPLGSIVFASRDVDVFSVYAFTTVGFASFSCDIYGFF